MASIFNGNREVDANNLDFNSVHKDTWVDLNNDNILLDNFGSPKKISVQDFTNNIIHNTPPVNPRTATYALYYGPVEVEIETSTIYTVAVVEPFTEPAKIVIENNMGRVKFIHELLPNKCHDISTEIFFNNMKGEYLHNLIITIYGFEGRVLYTNRAEPVAEPEIKVNGECKIDGNYRTYG